MIVPRPYILENSIQRYAWGTRGREAFIPNLLGIEPEPDVPYAEMWMGAHPSAPSKVFVEGESIPLDRWISEHPKELLGERVAHRFSDTLPFLLKVLSAGEPLSIQAHPSEAQAARLHEKDPEHYPDANHKPEIAVALDGLTALIGLKPPEAFRKSLRKAPELKAFLGNFEASDVSDAFKRLLLRSKEVPETLASMVQGVKERLQAKKSPDEEERLFLDLSGKYGSEDVGLPAIFFMNLVHLEKGRGLFIDAGIPHAYLRGNIVECMANSDNVVRVGLTPKFKDIETLVDILDCEPGAVDIIASESESDEIVYGTPAEEFEIVRWRMGSDRVRTLETRERPHILLIVEGEVELTGTGNGSFRRMAMQRGASAFVPASLASLRITTTASSEIYLVRVPG